MAKQKAEKSTEPSSVLEFASPDWVEKHVIPKGEQGAKLWRHLKGLWGEDLRRLRDDWERFSKGL